MKLFNRKPQKEPMLVANGAMVQQAVREEIRALATLMLDIRRDQLSPVSSQYLRILGISPLDYLGLKKEPGVVYKHLYKDGKRRLVDAKAQKETMR